MESRILYPLYGIGLVFLHNNAVTNLEKFGMAPDNDSDYQFPMMKQRPMSAWVIEWQSIATARKIKNRILHVLNARLHPETVIKYMQLLYANSEMESGIDRIASLSSEYWRCAHIIIQEGPRIAVGVNPYLMAWRVKDLTIEVDYEKGLEIFRWTQVPGERINQKTGAVEYLGDRIKREESLPHPR
jgi:hypothetical protein